MEEEGKDGEEDEDLAQHGKEEIETVKEDEATASSSESLAQLTLEDR